MTNGKRFGNTLGELGTVLAPPRLNYRALGKVPKDFALGRGTKNVSNLVVDVLDSIPDYPSVGLLDLATRVLGKSPSTKSLWEFIAALDYLDAEGFIGWSDDDEGEANAVHALPTSRVLSND